MMNPSDAKEKVLETFRDKGENEVRRMLYMNGGEYLPAIVEIALEHMRMMNRLALVPGKFNPRTDLRPAPQSNETRPQRGGFRDKTGVLIKKCLICSEPGRLTTISQGKNGRYPVVYHEGNPKPCFVTTPLKQAGYTVDHVERLIRRKSIKVEENKSKGGSPIAIVEDTSDIADDKPLVSISNLLTTGLSDPIRSG